MAGDIVVLGDLVTPSRVIPNGSMTIRGGKIVDVADGSDTSTRPGTSPHNGASSGASDGAFYGDGVTVIDARGKCVFPGTVDAHVHCYSELAEGFTYATAAAAVGGVTTIVEMPYDADKPVVDAARFEEKRAMLDGTVHVDVAMLGTIRKVDGVREIPAIVEAGACGFKVSMFETHATRFPRITGNDLLEAFELIAAAGLTVDVHAEDGEIIMAAVEKMRATGRHDPLAHGQSRPPIAESASTVLALELASVAGTQLHVCHASLPRVIDLVSMYKDQGYPVSVETCPHYLVLSEDDVERLGGYSKINPPLRDADAVEGLWERLVDGSIDIVSSDHAPWLAEKKQSPVIFDNSSGAPGVETLTPLLLHHGVVSGRLSMLDAARVLAETPAKRFGLEGQKGVLAQGADADFFIWDPAGQTVLRGEELHSKAQWTPYEGAQLRGRIESTYVRGTCVARDGDVAGAPGWGRFVGPRTSR